MKRLALILSLFATSVSAHEMTPTYPQLRPAYVDGLVTTELTMFNAREDVDYYEVGVFTVDWKAVPFATTSKILQVRHTERVSFDIYIRKTDQARATYVCTMSKLRSDKPSNAIIASKVCSRLDGALP